MHKHSSSHGNLRKMLKIIAVCAAGAVSLSMLTGCSESGSSSAEDNDSWEISVEPLDAPDISSENMQAEVNFPDWLDYVDDTLAPNSMYSFFGYHGQGKLYVQTDEKVKSFKMYVNGIPVDTSKIVGGKAVALDISGCTLDKTNTIQVSNIEPFGLQDAVKVDIPYPEVIDGDLKQEGLSQESFDLISDIIQTDIDNGFTSAQLSVVKNGRLVYENAWGLTNSYLPDGSPCRDSAPVTTDTMYDVASVTKMFTVNYAIQLLCEKGLIDLDAPITKFLGDEFAEDTIELPEEPENDEEQEEAPDLKTIKEWKAKLTVKDLMCHQSGFPADPQYPFPKIYSVDAEEQFRDNPLYAGNKADEATKQATIKMICKTPLEYEPGTKTLYSDVGYMVLGVIVEKVSGQDLDTYMKQNFYEPLGLKHITFNPLKNGFAKEDCAATELNGNTRDGFFKYDGLLTHTLQGVTHDEKAYYSMGGIAGHAGLFASATDLAKLASVMFSGGYGEHRFFSKGVVDYFTEAKSYDEPKWGIGWWRQGNKQRVWYYGTQSDSRTFGHQGYTGAMVVIDPDRDLIISYLTNKKNTPITNKESNANRFDGDWYTASTLGFVPQILSMGMDNENDIAQQYVDLTADMVLESVKLLPENVEADSDHPAAKNVRSKREVFEKTVNKYKDKLDKEQTELLTRQVEEALK